MSLRQRSRSKWESGDSTKPPSGTGESTVLEIFVPSDRYVWLEEYLYDFFEDFFADKRFGRRRRLLVNWETH